MRLSLPAARPLLAATLFATTVLAQTDRASESFQVGIGLLQRDLHDEAARMFETFLAANPQHALAAEAHYRLASCRLELGDNEGAIAPLRQALTRGGRSFKLRAEAQYRLGSALHQTGDHPAAHAALAELLREIDEGHYLRAAASFVDGESLRDAGDDAAAARAFLASAAADRDPAGGHAVPARYQAGFALTRLGDFAGAEAAFKAAAEGHPQHPACGECWYLAGDAAYRGGQHERALTSFAAAEKCGGDFADDAALGAAWAHLQQGDRAAARAGFARVVTRMESSPLAPRARLELGRLLQQDGEHVPARETLAPLLADATPALLRAEASEIAGLASAALGEHDVALQRLQAALVAAAPQARPRILVAIGASFAARAEWKQALEAYAQVAAAQQQAAQGQANAEPDEALAGEALYGMCLAMHRLGAFEESLRSARQFLERHGEHRLRDHAALAVAENLFATKKYAEAETAYALLERPDGAFSRDARFKRAWSIYLQGGRQAEAADVFAALSEDKAGTHAEEALSMVALAALEAGASERALDAADRYKVRHPQGDFLARTERVASRALQALGDLPAAAKRLTAAAALEGDGGRGRQDRLEVAELLFEQSDFAAAAERYEDLLAGDDAVAARALEGRAWCAFELGDDETAVRLVDRALEHPALGARLPDALQLRCATQQRADRWPDAAATAERFLRECAADPRAPEMRYALGLSLARAGEHDRAREVLGELARAGGGPNPDRTQYELAWACRKAGDEPAALAAFARVTELTQDEELAGEARLHVGEALLARGEREAARAQLEQVRGKHRARALYRAAFADLEDRPQAAQATFAALLAEDLGGSFTDDARFLVAEAAHRAGDHAHAATAYAAALRALPDHERAQAARVRAGESAVRSDRASDATGWLEEFLRRDQDGSDAGKVQRARSLLWLGQAHVARGDHERAADAFQQATNLTDTEIAAEAQFRLGEARRGKGDLDGAVDAFVKLSILYGHPEWVQRGLYEAGRCYRELDQPQKAERFFAELAQRFPDSSWTQRSKNVTTDDKRPR